MNHRYQVLAYKQDDGSQVLIHKENVAEAKLPMALEYVADLARLVEPGHMLDVTIRKSIKAGEGK